MEGNQRFFRCIGHSISVFIAIFIVCAAAAAAAAARFGLLGNFLFLFRREFMNSTWSIGAGGALEPPPARPFFSFGRASRTFAPFLPILNPFAMYVHVRVEPSEGTGKEREERRKERRKKGRFASLGLRACVISALCTINNRHRRHTS